MYIDSCTLEEVSDTVCINEWWVILAWEERLVYLEKIPGLDSAEVSACNACLFFSLNVSAAPSHFFFLFACLPDWQMQRNEGAEAHLAFMITIIKMTTMDIFS